MQPLDFAWKDIHNFKKQQAHIDQLEQNSIIYQRISL